MQPDNTKLKTLQQLLAEGEQSGDTDYDLDELIGELDTPEAKQMGRIIEDNPDLSYAFMQQLLIAKAEKDAGELEA
ncbi:type II toxin-antitoxin system ParD family antitoxin [Vibrio ruber]|uniref:type II toxin-antitoxin system ParD family antitoxin n=1 Tax=Vibrio ruber TaxID=184755 RepID=UPI0035DB9447